MTKARKLTIILSLLIVSMALDQGSKAIVRRKFEFHERIEVAGDFFVLTRIENKGAFLSLGDDLPEPLRWILLAILPVAALGGALWYMLSREISKGLLVGICLVTGGGIGNVWDRIAYGSVTDFMHMDLWLFRTGIFNIADVAITAGVIIIVLEMILTNRREKKALAEQAAQTPSPPEAEAQS